MRLFRPEPSPPEAYQSASVTEQKRIRLQPEKILDIAQETHRIPAFCSDYACCLHRAIYRQSNINLEARRPKLNTFQRKILAYVSRCDALKDALDSDENIANPE